MRKHLVMTISTFETGDGFDFEAPFDLDTREMALDITNVDQKSLEDIVWSAGLQLVRSITNTPTPVKEGGRG